uniref:autotransporter-associated beta strand repeat-containing protein n=1 Tax=Xanthomonas sp. 0924 TaxID=2835534 RepID=UPI003F80D3E5
MNRAFALVWNAAIGNWVVTHELVRRRRKPGATRRSVSSLVVLAVGAAAPMLAWGACTPALPAAGATVTCTGLPITSNSFASSANNLTINVAAGTQMTAGLLGGTAIALTGTNATLNNSGTIDPSALGLLSVLSTGVSMGNASSTTVTANNLATGAIYGTGGLLGANLLNLDGMALGITSASNGVVQINNAGLIDSRALLNLSVLSADTPVIAVSGGGTVNAVNTGTINGRVGFQSSATGNSFVNAGTINGSVSMGAGSTNSFTAVTGGSVNSGGGLALELLGPGGLLSFAQTGVVDGGAGGTNTLILQNSATGTGSGSTGVGTLSTAQYINFGSLRVNSGTWSVGGGSNFGSSALNGGVLQFANPAQLGTAITANGGALEATAAGLSLSPAGGITLGAGGLTLQGANALTIASPIVGTGALTKTGTGALGLTGSNTFSGGVNLLGGSVTVGTNGALGTGAVNVSAGSVLSSAAVDLPNAFVLNDFIGIGGANTLRIGGGISGAGALNKIGTGTLTLGGSNTYAGGTTLGAGTLRIETNTALGAGTVTAAGGQLDTSAPLTLANNVALTNTLGLGASGNALTLTGTLAGAGGVNKTGTGTLALNGANTFAGGTTLASGTLQLGSASALGTGGLNVTGASNLSSSAPLTVANGISLGGPLNWTGAQALTLSGAINGGGSLIKSGAGDLTLTGNNAYTGGTSLSTGRLVVGSNAALGTGTLTASGGELDATAAATLGNTIALTGSLGVGSSGNALNLTGAIGGTGALNKLGTGSLTLGGLNTYAGGTNLTAGTLQVASGTALGTGALNVNGNAALQNTAATSLSNAIALTPGALTLSGAQALTLSGAISGTGSLIKSGSGDLTLSGNNLYSGGTTLSAGTLTVGSDTALGVGALSAAAGTTLDNATVSTLANAIALAGLVNVGGSNALTLTGAITGVGSLDKLGPASLTLAGNNSYTGGTRLSAGSLILGSDTALGLGTLTVGGGLLDSTAARVLANNVALEADLQLGGSQDLTLTGAVSGVGGVVKDGNAALTLAGPNSFAGGVDLNAGALLIGDGAALGTGALTAADGTQLQATAATTIGNAVVLNGALSLTGNNDLGVTGIVSGAGSLIKQGAGALTLTGNNVYTGGTLLDTGILSVGSDSALGTGALTAADGTQLTASTAVTLQNAVNVAGQLAIDGQNLTLDGVVDGAGRLIKNGTQTLTLNGNNTWAGGLQLQGGAVVVGSDTALGLGTLSAAAGTTLDASSAVTLGNALALNGALTLPGTQDITLNGVVSGSGSLDKQGAATLTLANANTFSGGVALDTGRVVLGNDAALGVGALLVGGPAELDAAAALTLGNAVQLNDQLTLVGSNDLGLNGAITGSGSLIKNGATTLSLNAGNSYSGGTTLTAGTIAVGANDALGTGSLSVVGNAALSNAIAVALGNDIALGAALTVDNGADMLVSGSISGTGDLIKTGAGTLTLNGSNSYTGPLAIQAGTLVASTAASLGNASNVDVVAGAVLNLSNGGLISALSGAGNVTTDAGGTLQLGGGDFGGSLGGGGNLDKVGAGTVRLLGNSAIGGATQVSGGTLDVIGTLGTSAVNVALGGTLTGTGTTGNVGSNVTIADGGRLALTSGSSLSVGGLTLAPGAFLDVALAAPSNTRLLAVNGDLTLDGTLNITDIGGFGTGVYRLIDYTGLLTNNGLAIGLFPGSVDLSQLALQTAIGQQLNLVVTAPGSIVQFWDGVQTTANGTVDGGAGTWGAATNWTNQDGTANSTWQGDFAVFAGNAAAVGVVGTQSIGGLQFVTDGYQLTDAGAGGLAVTAPLTAIRVDPGATASIDVAISGSGGVEKLDTGTLVLDAANSYTGGTALSGGTLVLGDAQALGTGTLTAATGTNLDSNQALAVGNAVVLDGALNLVGSNDLRLSGPISGAGSVIKNGASTLTLDGANSYVGGSVLNAGTLAVGSNTALGVGSLSVLGNATLSNAIALALGNAVNLGADLTIASADDLALTGVLSGAGALTKTGLGTLTLSGGNTFTGPVSVQAGVLATTAPGALGNTSVVDVAAGAGLSLGSNAALGAVTGQGNVAVLGGTTLQLGANNVGSTFAGSLSDAGNLDKVGTGTLQLTGTSALGGTTQVTAGTLDVDGTLASAGGLTVGSGASLSGSGVVDAAVTVNDGGRLVVTSGAVLTTGSLSLAPTATLDAFLGIPSQTGVLAVNGDLTLDGTLNITDIGGFGTGVYRLIDYTGGLTDNGLGIGTLPGTIDPTQLTLQTALAQQVNVVVLAPGSNVQFWDGAQTIANGSIDGGAGVWAAGPTNWTSIDGLSNSDWQNSFAVFAGTAGNVGVQGTQGITGMQFVSDGYVLSDAGGGALSANAATTIIRVDPGVTGTIDVGIGGTGTLQKLDTGTLVLSAANTYTGGTALGGGTLVLGDAQALGTGTLTAAAGTSLDTDQALAVGNAVVLDGAVTLLGSNDLALTGAISGAGSVIKTGAFTLTLSGNNSYAGGTALSDGTLSIGSNNALGTGSLSVVGDAVLTNPVAATVGNAVVLGAALSVDNPADLTLAGDISGSGALIKTNTGTLTLDGSSSYTGGTTVNAGTLVGDSASLQGAIVDNATLAFNQVADGVFTGSITGTGSVIKDGAGALVLNGANGYTGGTTITAGTLIGDTSSLQGDIANNAALVFNQNTGGVYAGTLSGTGSLQKAGTGALQLLGPNTYTGGTVISAGSLIGNTTSLQGNIVDNATLVFDQASDGVFAGAVSGTGSVVKQGTGALTLAEAGNYSGGTVLASGSLVLGDAQALGTGTLTAATGTTLDTDQALTVTNAVELAGAVAFAGSNDLTLTGAVTGTGGLIKNGVSTLTLDGSSSYTGGTTVNAGTLVGDSASLQGAIVDNATLVFNQVADGVFTGSITGTGNVIKDGAGALLLNGANGYTGGTTITAGTLIGDTTSLQGDIANNAALVFNQNTGGVYAGTLSGTGSLQKAGTGALQLLGPNTYTGGTVISAGSLIGNTTSLQGNIVDNATLVFDQASDGVFAGAVSGTGSVVKQGAGALTLVAPNTYSGGTTIASGSLIGTTTSLQGNIVNNATLVFDQAGDGTFAGNITGSGTLIKNGAGAVTLDGVNAYLGGTTINAGTLIGDTESLQGNIANAGALVFQQTANGTYAGILSGTGSLLKDGVGTLLVTANSSGFTGPTTIVAGTLSVGNPANPGAALGGPVTVGPGGTLTGSGSIGGLTSGGTVAIGGSTGTISVGGNVALANGSTLQVTPGAGGTVTPISVGGAATLAPGSTLQLVRATDLPLFTEIPVISAAGGLTGRFTNVVSDYAFVTPNVSASATALSVSFGRNTVAMVDAVTAPNQQAAAAAVDGLPTTSPVYQAVVRLPDDPQAISTAFASLSGESHASTATALLDSHFLLSGVGNHLRGDSQDAQVGDTTVWITGRSLPNRVDGDANTASVRREDNGVMAGAERRIGERSVVGVAVGNQDIETRSRESLDRSDIDGTHAGIYAQADWSAFAMQAVVDYADYSVDSSRRVMLPGVLEERLTSNYDAKAVTVSLEAAWNLRTGNAVYSPFVAADYTHLKTDGFDERGGIAGLSVDSAKDEYTTSTVGVRGRWQLGAAAGVYASVGWRHAFGDRAVERSAGFVGSGSQFSVQSVTLAKNAVVGELGVSLITSPNSRMALSLQGLNGDGQTAYGGQVTWGWSF